MNRFATSALSVALASLVLGSAFAQDTSAQGRPSQSASTQGTPAQGTAPQAAPADDMASMPGMEGMEGMKGMHDMSMHPLPAAVAAAVADPGRAEDAKIDARRHGGELVAFSGVKAGDHVLELVPGSGYFTRIFSKVVGPEGRVYAIVPKPMEKYSDKTKLLPQSYPNVEVLLQPADALTTPQPVDVAFTSQNYHDYPDKFMGPTDPAILDKAVFAALKPGGTYIVIDHVAEAGSGTRDTETLHRIDPAFVKQQVEAAGFEFVGQSDVLHNAGDDHKAKVFDDSIRGHTDQFVYKFRKPAADHAHMHH